MRKLDHTNVNFIFEINKCVKHKLNDQLNKMSLKLRLRRQINLNKTNDWLGLLSSICVQVK